MANDTGVETPQQTESSRKPAKNERFVAQSREYFMMSEAVRAGQAKILGELQDKGLPINEGTRADAYAVSKITAAEKFIVQHPDQAREYATFDPVIAKLLAQQEQVNQNAGKEVSENDTAGKADDLEQVITKADNPQKGMEALAGTPLNDKDATYHFTQEELKTNGATVKEDTRAYLQGTPKDVIGESDNKDVDQTLLTDLRRGQPLLTTHNEPMLTYKLEDQEENENETRQSTLKTAAKIAEEGKSPWLKQDQANEDDRRKLEDHHADQPLLTDDHKQHLLENPVETSSSSPTGPREHFGRIINTEEGSSAHLLAQGKEGARNEHAKGRLWEIWRWPKKVYLRLNETRSDNVLEGKLRQKALLENTPFLSIAGMSKRKETLSQKIKRIAKHEFPRPTYEFSQESLQEAQRRQQQTETHTLSRFKSDAYESKIGEKQEQLTGEVRSLIMREVMQPILDGQVSTQAEVAQLLRDFVARSVSDNKLGTEVQNKIREYFGATTNAFGNRAEFFATDLLELGNEVKKDMKAFDLDMDAMDSHIHLMFGLARTGAVENMMDITDRALAKVKIAQENNESKGKLKAFLAGRHGIILNPFVTGVTTALAVNGVSQMIGYGGRAAGVWSFGLGEAVAGFTAAGRNWAENGRQRAQHGYDMAVGGKIPEQQKGALRSVARAVGDATGGMSREQIEKLSYNTVSFEQLEKGGGEDLNTHTERISVDVLEQRLRANPQDTEARSLLISRQAELDARQNLSYNPEKYGRSRTINLIRYEDVVEANSGATIVLQARIAEVLRQTAQGNMEELDAQGLATATGRWTDKLNENILDQDRTFNRQRAIKAVQSGLTAAATGAAGYDVLHWVRDNFHIPGSIANAAGVEQGKHNINQLQENIKQALSSDKKEVFHSENITAAVDGPKGTVHIVEHTLNPGHKTLQELHSNLASNGLDTSPIYETKISGPSILEQIQKALSEHKHYSFNKDGFHGTVENGKFSLSGHGIQELHGTISQNGNITLDNLPGGSMEHVKQELRSAGFTNIHETVVDKPFTVEQQGVFWKEHVTNVGDIKWYDNNTKIPDFSELQERTASLPNGAARLYFSGPYEPHQTGLIPEWFNYQQLAAAQKLAYIFYRHGDPKQAIAILGNQKDGSLVLDPSSPGVLHEVGGKTISEALFAKTVMKQGANFDATEFNHNYDAWKLGHGGLIGAGYVDQEHGVLTDNNFAMIQATGQPEQFGIPTTLLHATPPATPEASYQFAFDAHNPGELIPPLPWAPRNPMGSIESPNIDFPPPPYYSGEGLKESRDWLEQNPQNHKPYHKETRPDGTEVWLDMDGRPVERNVNRERAQIQEFLDNLRRNDPDHYKQIEELEHQISPMNEHTRVAVNIPAYMEGKTIYSLLDQYTKQQGSDGKDLDSSTYEINIIVNRKTGEPEDQTVAEIERFKTDAAAKGKNYQINYVNVEFPEPFNNVGNARRVITNLTLLRSLHRKNQDGSLYIESEDADLLNIDRNTVINLLTKLDENPHLDAVRGIQDRSPEIMMSNDMLFLYRRFQDFKEVFLHRQRYRPENNPDYNFNWNRVITGGWNTAYTAEAYTLTGGYNPYQTKGEDMLIGERLSMVRGDGTTPNTSVIGRVSTRNDSSPRRYIWEVATGKAAYGDGFEDPQVNALIRDKAPEELMQFIEPYARINQANAPRFQAMLNNEFNFIKSSTPNEQEAQNVMNRVLFASGFQKGDYEYNQDGAIAIKNWGNVEAALNEYRNRHQNPRQPGDRTRRQTFSSSTNTQTYNQNTTNNTANTASHTTGQVMSNAQQAAQATTRRVGSAVKNATSNFVNAAQGATSNLSGSSPDIKEALDSQIDTALNNNQPLFINMSTPDAATVLRQTREYLQNRGYTFNMQQLPDGNVQIINIQK